MRVALTFDDGPSEWTEDLLTVLSEHEVKATFFVCGNQIEGRENILRRIVKRGHEVGNHTMTHPNLQGLSKMEVFHELVDCSQLIHDLTGVLPKVYRPPYLRDCDAARAVAEAVGMTGVGCDVIPGDWENPYALEIAKAVVMESHDNAVILLHDGRPAHQPPHEEGGSLDSRRHTVNATARLVPELLERGYEFVTASEILRELAVA